MKILYTAENEFCHPERQHSTDAGSDLKACRDTTLFPDSIQEIHTGVRVDIPKGTVGLLMLRSGFSTQHGTSLVNGFGVIDPGYRGEIVAKVYTKPGYRYKLKQGERFAQLLIVPMFTADFTEVSSFDALPASERGEGGFGSTGK